MIAKHRPFKIQCYLPIHNEADILIPLIKHMSQQGIACHVLDGWSTDGSYEILKNAGRYVTVERFPEQRDDGIWNCRRTLARIEELAAKADAEWCYLSDADEFRRSPIPDELLDEGIWRVNAEGYNAVDHEVFSFVCTGEEDWEPGDNPESHFQFYNPDDMIARLPQIKAWRNVRRVDLVSSGGHEARFPGRKVYPQKFVMKHYPYRTPEQARRKLETRLARRCHEEHDRGWGVHYDEQFPPGFIWDPETVWKWPERKPFR